jgi:hypothetical protein
VGKWLLLSADLGLHDGGESDDARSSNLKENKKKRILELLNLIEKN